jgi:hypothetical protein
VVALRVPAEGGVVSRSMLSDDVTVVGGGWSVSNIAVDRLAGCVVAVNDSALHLPRWDVCVSMDRLWAENRIDRVLERSTEESPTRAIWLRRAAVQNLLWIEKYPWIRVFECDHESAVFSPVSGFLNGTSSGMCALNLAWQVQPKRVFLLGFDMNRHRDGAAYWYPPYPWSSEAGSTSNAKYAKWAGQYARIAADFRRRKCEVYNVSPGSALTAFPRISPTDYLRLTK